MTKYVGSIFLVSVLVSFLGGLSIVLRWWFVSWWPFGGVSKGALTVFGDVLGVLLMSWWCVFWCLGGVPGWCLRGI